MGPDTKYPIPLSNAQLAMIFAALSLFIAAGQLQDERAITAALRMCRLAFDNLGGMPGYDDLLETLNAKEF